MQFCLTFKGSSDKEIEIVGMSGDLRWSLGGLSRKEGNGKRIDLIKVMLNGDAEW